MSLRSVFLKRLVKRSTMTSFPSINQVTNLAATHRPVVMQRKVPQIRTVLKTVELRRIPNPISQNLLMKDLRKWRNAPDTGAADTGADDKDPRRLVLGSKQLVLELVARTCQLGECFLGQ